MSMTSRSLLICTIYVLFISCEQSASSNEIENKSSVEESMSASTNFDSTSIGNRKADPVGFIRIAYPDGKIKAEGTIIEGKKLGVWKFYDNTSKLQDVGHYVDDTLFLHLDTSDFNFKTIYIKPERLSIKLPSHWNIIHSSEKGILLQAYKLQAKGIFTPNISVTANDKINYSLETFLQNYLQNLNSKYEAKIVFNKSLKIDSEHQSFQIGYMFEANGVNVGAIVTFIKSDHTVYIIAGVAANEKSKFIKYEGLFEEIGTSLSIY